MTNLLHAGRIGNQRPRLSALPAARRSSSGPDAVEFAESCGLVLDDWQAWVLDGMLSEDEHHRLCASTSVLIMPRQNGKNAVLEALELYALYVLGLRRIVHTAHLGDTAAEHMARMAELIDANDDLARITSLYRANGKERITRTDTGAQIRFITRSTKTGRGPSPQMVVFDEALHLTEQHVQAIIPSLSAQSMRHDKPLNVYTSSAPLPESTVLNRLRRQMVTGMEGSFYAEWSCEEGADPLDRENWYEANPSLGIRISEEYIAETELAVMSREAFLIERLGVVPGDQSETGVIPLEKWAALVDQTVPPLVGFPSVAVGPGGLWAAVGFAHRRDNGTVDVQVVRHEAGTGWLLEACQRAYADLQQPIVVDVRSETAGVIARLKEAGIPVQEIAPKDWTAACVGFRDDVVNLRLRHRDQPGLNAAVAGVDVRPSGEAWVFSAKASGIDITPLLAVTLAAIPARKPVVHVGVVDLADFLD